MAELMLEAKVENLNQVIGFVDEQLEMVDCPMKAQMQIDVAVEELFINVASYAYQPGTGSVSIEMETGQDPSYARITFSDSGVPFDPVAREDPDVSLSLDKRGIGGLGIYMTKKSMDEMRYQYRDGQNLVTILKKW